MPPCAAYVHVQMTMTLTRSLPLPGPAMPELPELRETGALPLEIRRYPDVSLRLVARELEIFDKDLAALAERMTEMMATARGVGLAAPQVGRAQRLIVVRDRDKAVVLANPVILDRADTTDVAEEGCLSLPGLYVEVERPTRVKIEAARVDGRPVKMTFDGFTARVVQHEIDHLNGVLHADYLPQPERRLALVRSF